MRYDEAGGCLEPYLELCSGRQQILDGAVRDNVTMKDQLHGVDFPLSAKTYSQQLALYSFDIRFDAANTMTNSISQHPGCKPARTAIATNSTGASFRQANAKDRPGGDAHRRALQCSEHFDKWRRDSLHHIEIICACILVTVANCLTVSSYLQYFFDVSRTFAHVLFRLTSILSINGISQLYVS